MAEQPLRANDNSASEETPEQQQQPKKQKNPHPFGDNTRKRVHLFLRPDQIVALEQLARRAGQSRADYLRDLVRDHLVLVQAIPPIEAPAPQPKATRLFSDEEWPSDAGGEE